MRSTPSIGFVLLALALAACGGHGRPEDPASQLAFGVEMARRGLWSEAYFRFEQAARLDPGSSRIANNLAVAAEALGRFEEAQKHYQEALRQDPGNAELKRNYARFIEFYQAYQRREEEGAGEGGTPAADAGGGEGSQPEGGRPQGDPSEGGQSPPGDG